MVFIVLKAADGVTWAAVWAAVAYYSLITFAAGSMFVTSFMDMPLPIQKITLTPSTILGGAIIWGAFAFVAFSFVASASWIPPGSEIGHITIAGVIVLEQVVIFRVLYDLRQSPLEDRLVDLRRDLILHRVNPAFAARSAEVTLIGIDGRAVVEEYLLRTIDLIARFRESASHARLAAMDVIAHADTLVASFDGFSGIERKQKLEELEKLEERSAQLLKSASREARRIRSRSSGFNSLIRTVKEQTPAALEDLADTALPTIAGEVQRASDIFEEDASYLEDIRTRVRERCAGVKAAAGKTVSVTPA